MRWFRFAVLVLVAAVMQAGFAGLVSVVNQNVRPDLLLILLVFFAVRRQGRDAVIASFAIGLAADLANPAAGFMGPRIVSYGLLGTVLSELNSILLIRRIGPQAITIFVMGVFVCLFSLVLVRLRIGQTGVNMDRELFWQPLLSGIIGPFLFWPADWWMQLNKRRRQRVR
jgi:rod shape-determining protein MreD